MNNTDANWELYRTFLAVMRSGSMSAAARLLSSTQPTVGRHIEQLEQALGLSLFARSPNGVRPSPAAYELLQHVETMDASAAALKRAAANSMTEESGVVRLTASHVVGSEVLPPILTEFRRNHPRIAIELVLSNTPDDLLRGDADLAIRMFRPTQAALVAKRIGPVPVGLFAHRDYATRRGLPEQDSDLAGHDLIGYDRDPVWINAAAEIGIHVTPEQFSFRCDSELAQLSALRAGFGISACHVAIAGRNPDLLPVLPERVRFELDMWLVMHEDMRSVAPVALMFEHLSAPLQRYVSSVLGPSA